MSEQDKKQDKKDKNLAEYVENKIFTYTLKAKNFTRDDMDRVDNYCKKYFGNDRRKMILTLITTVENNVLYNVLDDKVNLITSKLVDEIDRLNSLIVKEEPSEVKPVWKGLSKKTEVVAEATKK